MEKKNLPSNSQNLDEKKKDPLKSGVKKTNYYLKYSGMVLQLFVLLVLALWLGQKMDQRLSFKKPIVTIVLMLLALAGYFYKLYIDLSKDHE